MFYHDGRLSVSTPEHVGLLYERVMVGSGDNRLFYDQDVDMIPYLFQLFNP
jgi:hypothetical protein